MYTMKTGAIYAIRYVRWKTNFKVYAFIMYAGPGSNKVHALNLAARQLNTIDRAKMVKIIAQLARIPNASKYDGRLLYRIFLTYMPNQMKKCYRTYFHSAIYKVTLLNYGLNNPSDFTQLDNTVYNRELYNEVHNDWLVRAMNWYTKRGVQLKNMVGMFAKETPVITEQDVDPYGQQVYPPKGQ